MKKVSKISILVILLGLIAFIYYYVALPAINIHSVGFWYFIISLFIILTICAGIHYFATKGSGYEGQHKLNPFTSKLFKICSACTILSVVIFLVGSLFSSPIINASKYRQLIQLEERNFTEDIKEISYDEIPLLDKASATLLGSRKMGSMIEYVSQFEVSEDYTQINYQNKPVRVTPLEYGNLFKWFSNRSKGIPAYIRIDMATQNVECVQLQSGIKYSESDHFGRNIYRYLRFRYPTYIFDNLNFEINEEGIPYWICPVKDFTIGLFGGQTVSNVVLVNAITGEHTNYDVTDVPSWVDRVYSSELLISYYDYYGSLKHGYWNTLFSQKDCLKTTNGYNYIVLEDDVWVYTGVTSVGGDQSNVGFVLMNQRTSETRYYSISGAEEYSAMSSAEGQVQNLGYKATFPLLMNIANEPTYFLALKDDAGLVKKYAMVNIAKYQIVAIGDTVTDCEAVYVNLLKNNGISTTDHSSSLAITGTIKKIAESVIGGNSHYYILLEETEEIFDVAVNDHVSIIKYNIGDTIQFTYSPNINANTVLEIK